MIITRENVVQITEDAGLDPSGIVWDHVADPAYRPEDKCLAIFSERGDLAKFLITLGAWAQSSGYEIQDYDPFTNIKFHTSGRDSISIFPSVFVEPSFIEDDEFMTTEEIVSKALLTLAKGYAAELSITQSRARVALLFAEHMDVLKADGLSKTAQVIRDLALGKLVHLKGYDLEICASRLRELSEMVLEEGASQDPE